MVFSPELKLVIKHTFLEYVDDNRSCLDHSPKRQRSQTEPFINEKLDYSEVREKLHGSDSSSCSSHEGDCTTEYSTTSDDLDAWQNEPSQLSDDTDAAVLSTPETTPLLVPMARHMPGLLQEDWAEASLPQSYYAQQQIMQEYCHWNEHYNMVDWWTPAPVAVELGLPLECSRMSRKQFQTEPSTRNQAGLLKWLMDPSQEADSASTLETRTSVMLRDLPEAFSRSSLLNLLDVEGFSGQFDFVYLPVDFKNRRNLGYALINMVSSAEALRITAHFQNFSNWSVPSEKICSVGWCSPQQGLEAHVERYRNSPVMHESVPDEWRPMVLSRGVPIPFPAPTQRIKPPKVKGRQA